MSDNDKKQIHVHSRQLIGGDAGCFLWLIALTICATVLIWKWMDQ